MSSTSFYLYCATSEYCYKKGLVKIGCTTQPISRLCTYNTGDAPGIGLDKYYLGLWEIRASSSRQMKLFETHVHLKFHTFRTRRGKGYTEWFNVLFNNVQKYIQKLPCFLRNVSLEEIHEIHKKASEIGDENPDDGKIDDIDIPFRDVFFETFLSDKKPRRVQSELFDIYTEKVKAGNYRGIVNWPTAVGKSIGIMILIVLTFKHFQQNGKQYKGVLISNRNDIFDTLQRYLNLLPFFGINVVRCDNGNFTEFSKNIHLDQDVLFTVTHQSMTSCESWKDFSIINHVHYDEVHRITGDIFFKQLEKLLDVLPFLTGTSATPRTSDKRQCEKLQTLFGNPLSILHACSIEEAIKEGWIAHPRFGVHVMSNTISRVQQLCAFFDIVEQTINNKEKYRKIKGGKHIVYIPLLKEIEFVIEYASKKSTIKLYNAINSFLCLSDKDFVSAPLDGNNHVLLACGRYLEGSDIYGLETTSILMGKELCAFRLLQIQGRTLRADYPGKEGWCVIVRPSEDGYTEDDIFESIVIDNIMSFIGQGNDKPNFEHIVRTYFGTVSISGQLCDVEETIKRVQALYERRHFNVPIKEKYEKVKERNSQLNISSKKEYLDSKDKPLYISNPDNHFHEQWKSWYDFFGKDIQSFVTKDELIAFCRQQQIFSFQEYQALQPSLSRFPQEPSECYEDWTNWTHEIGENPTDTIW